MGSLLRRCCALAGFVAVLVVLLAVAEPASGGQDKDKGGHAPKAVGVSSEQPPGLAGNVHAQAKGHEKPAEEAPADLGVSVPADPAVEPEEGSTHKAKPAGAKSQAQGGGGSGNSSSDAHHHVIVCHRTGSDSNPYVVINIPWTAWSEAHSFETGSHPTLNGRDDILLQDPASRPGSKNGFTKGDCRVNDPVPPPPPGPTPPAPPPNGGGVASGGALGSDPGSAGRGALPFTGLSVLVVVLVALGAAVSAAGIAGSTGQKSQRLQRWARKPADRSDVRHVTADEALDSAPDDSGSG
jgi:hypothetical protein